MMSKSKLFLAALNWVLDSLGTLFGIVLGVLILLMSAEIAMRYFNLGAMPWLIEVAEYLMCGGTFLAAPWVLRENAHVRVDILLASLPRKMARRLEQGLDLCGFGVSLVLLYYGIAAVVESVQAHTVVFKSWWIAEWILLLPVPIAFMLLSVEFVLRFFRVEGVVSDRIDQTGRASI